jgi:predicted nucleic acid-binding protein
LPEIICNTSPLQYLHQLGLLHLLSNLAGRVVVPSAVVRELSAGRAQGVELPAPEQLDWITVRTPHSAPVIPLAVDLGAGETEVLALALESADAEVLLDDALARRIARMLGLRYRGTLGLLLDAKKAGLLAAVGPILDCLRSAGFRLNRETERNVLELAGESR